MTDSPNASNEFGVTPFTIAKNAEIGKILKSFNNLKNPKVSKNTKPPNERFVDAKNAEICLIDKLNQNKIFCLLSFAMWLKQKFNFHL